MCSPFFYNKTNMLFIATYIYTYSGDAPMDARWINLVCMSISEQTNTNQWPKLPLFFSVITPPPTAVKTKVKLLVHCKLKGVVKNKDQHDKN